MSQARKKAAFCAKSETSARYNYAGQYGFTISTILSTLTPLVLAPVVQKLDSTIHRINLYPMDSAIGFPNTYPLDRDLSDGQCYQAFEQLHGAWRNLDHEHSLQNRGSRFPFPLAPDHQSWVPSPGRHQWKKVIAVDCFGIKRKRVHTVNRCRHRYPLQCPSTRSRSVERAPVPCPNRLTLEHGCVDISGQRVPYGHRVTKDFVFIFLLQPPVEGMCCKPKYRANIIHHFIFVFFRNFFQSLFLP